MKYKYDYDSTMQVFRQLSTKGEVLNTFHIPPEDLATAETSLWCAMVKNTANFLSKPKEPIDFYQEL